MKAQAVARPNLARKPVQRPERVLSARPKADAHERQASQAADQFARGEAGLGGLLTPAPAAALRLPHASAAGLPGELRLSLEQAFGADLSAVRIYTGVEAQSAARGLQARAFTAGASIYFGFGAWAPGSVAGRLLVAHEVAHTLQQGARAASGGRLRVEPGLEGGPGVQRDPDPNELVRQARDKLAAGYAIEEGFSELGLLEPESGVDAALKVIERHLVLPADAAAASWAPKVRTAIENRTTEDATNRLDALLVTVPEADRVERVTALFFDCYKALGAGQDAADLAGEAFPATTSFGSWAFYAAHRRGDATWVMPLLRKHPVASKYVNAITAVARIDFYGMARGGLDLDPEMKFGSKMADAIVEALLYQPLMPEERAAVALKALCVFNQLRLSPFTDFQKRLKGEKSLMMRFQLKTGLIAKFKDPDFLSRLGRNANLEPEVLQIADDAGRRTAPIATRALAYWDQVFQAANAAATREGSGAVLERATALQQQLRKRLPAIKELAGVEKSLIAALGLATQLERGGMPSPTALAANLKAGAAAVTQITYRIDGALAAREKDLQVKALPEIDESAAGSGSPAAELTDDMAYGIVLVVLFALQHQLVQYKPPAKAKGDALFAQLDEAAAEYQAVAANFRHLGTYLGYPKLVDAALAAYNARQKGVTRSYVGLLAPFAEVPSTTLKDFSKDFPKGQAVGTVFAGQSFVEAAYAIYYGSLFAKLTDALQAKATSGTREFDYTPGQEPIINTAIKAVEAAYQVPRKYRVPQKSTVLFVRPEDRSRVSSLLDDNHPYFVDLRTNEIGVDEIYAVPHAYAAHTEGFTVWAVPGMDQMASQLAAEPLLAGLTDKKGKPIGRPEEYERPWQWLKALSDVVGSDATLKKTIADVVRRWMADSFKALDAPLRRATNNERRVVGPLISAQWERVQKSFLKDPKAYYDAPRAAIRFTLVFAGNIAPATPGEQRLQMTGLMLELAPVLERKLGEATAFGELLSFAGTQRLDIVLPLYLNVKGAAEFAADGANAAELGTLELDFKAAEVAQRARMLAKLAAAFKATAEEYQAQTQLQGSVSDNALRVPERAHPLIGKTDPTDEVDDTMLVGGVVYQLVKVHRNFSYQPELMAPPSAIQWSEENIGNRQLWVDGEAVKAGAPPIELFTVMRTATGADPVTITVTSDDVKLLSEVTYALHMHIVMQNLEALADVLNEGAGFLTLAIQLAFPEFAAEIAYAEIAGTVLQFLGSAEYQQFKTAFDTDAGSSFGAHLKKLKAELSLETLWTWFLFDQLPPELAKIRTAAQLVGRLGMFRNKGDDKTKSATRRVFGRLEGIGEKVVDGAVNLQEQVSLPVRKMETFVQGSPWLAILLRLLARNLHRVEGMNLKEFGLDQSAEMLGEVQQMYRRFETVIDSLSQYELPEELVALEDILQMLVQLVIDRLPIKYRVPLKAAQRVGMDKVLNWLLGKLADALREASLDPNILWRKYARDAIDPYLKSAATTVSDEVHGVLTRVPFLKNLAALEVPEVGVRFLGGEPQPKLARGMASPRAASALPAGPGERMPGAQQALAQRHWGHDFSHVRLHRGGTVDTRLREAGAVAATSGSHVYVDSAVRTDGAVGREVINHELAHVLQQGGARPLGKSHSPAPLTPAAGSSAAGRWHFDPAAEAQADRLAAAAREPAHRPRDVGRGGGVQPKFTDLVVKFFNKLGDPTALKEHAQKLGETPLIAKALEQAAAKLKDKALFEKLDEALKGWNKPGSVVGFTKPFDAAAADLMAYLQKNRREDLRSKLPHVLMSALHKVDVKKDGQKEDAWILIPGRLEVAIEEFFFGVTGISVDVEFKTSKQAQADGKQRDTIDPDQPFARLQFNYVHFPMIGGGAEIWDHLIQHSFPKVTDQKRQALYQIKTRLALSGLQPGPGLFAAKAKGAAQELVLAKRSRELVEVYVNPPPSQKLPGDAAPPWQDYILPAKKGSAAVGQHGQIGLRLGFYKDRDNPGEQKGMDRASHHTVQYLLLEYFVNSKDRHKPFPHLSLYPNIKASSGRVELISPDPDGTAGIRIAANETDRGGTMPTILLSVHAHTLGDVHVSPQPDDLPNAGPSQGAAIHGIYKSALGEYEGLVFSKEGMQALANKRKGKAYDASKIRVGAQEATPEGLSTAIYNATNKTYTWMRDHMNDKLAAAIDTRELEYYKALVETATDASINPGGKPLAAYMPDKVGSSIRDEVLKRQAAVFHSVNFGFKEMK
ncbi:DUF4157 domain-containing protein (plasmid) [Cupriavidus sp. P-10]|uniref:eCIS core domain-containing protein n=1 Tax=Cupriavidus sp. P-10 TaxID=2027911 RepID=UPI000E2F6B03|nr:DUF4157 domain-containing protein [Cupriavidus sp. P-10]BDB28721.1 DUF4157 domain-containing protein [Cupriavidus sp. P-10]